MNEFIAERVKLVRQLAEKADPFTRARLLRLAEGYDEKLGPPIKLRPFEPIGYPLTSIGSER
jgi:hypothetical protein